MSKIFVTRRIFQKAIEMLEKEGHDVEINDSSEILSKKELIQKTQNKDGLICLLNDQIDDEVIDSCPNLSVISNVAVGYDNIDLETATRRDVMVTNTPGVLTETTADLTFSLLLSAARRIPEADEYSRKNKYGGWELIQPHMGVDVHGKTLGIVGMGRIGKAMAKRGHLGFGMKIVYTSTNRHLDVEKELNAERVEFKKLLRESDFISIHTPLTEETESMFGSSEFKKMKKDSILINAARGPIVKEDELAESLKEGEIRGAAIDTFEKEPLVNPKLGKIKKHVVLTPHIGSASKETRLKMSKMAAENMIIGLRGEKPPNLVNKKVI